MFVAGIGSRDTPNYICDEMTKIGEWIRTSDKFYLQSGHAEGADWAFEKGCQEKCISYLPWYGFNKHLKSSSMMVIPHITNLSREITKKYHPAADKLSTAVFNLHCRNSYQILGSELGEIKCLIKPSRVTAVICWTNNGKDTGGTGQALRIAHGYNIPILNMYFNEWNTAEKVILYLDKL